MVPNKFDTQVYNLVHAQYQGCTVKKAAVLLIVPEREIRWSIRRLRKHVEVVLLTERQRRVRDYILEYGFTHKQIAELIGTTVRSVEKIVTVLKAKGVIIMPRPKTEQYKNDMDNRIEEKF